MRGAGAGTPADPSGTARGRAAGGGAALNALIWFFCFAAAGALQAALARLLGLHAALLAVYPAAAWLAGRLCARVRKRSAPNAAADGRQVCFCRRCGARLPEAARFCSRCGTENRLEERKS